MRATVVVAWTLVVILAAALAVGVVQYASRDKEVSALQSALKTLEQQLRTRAATQQKLTLQLEAAQEEIGRVREELRQTSASLKSHQSGLEEEKQKVAAARSEVSQLKAKLDEMTPALSRFEAEKKNLAETRNEFSALKTRLEEVSERLKLREGELQQARTQAEIEKAGLPASVKRLQGSIQELERDLSGARAELGAALKENEALKVRDVSSTKAVAALRDENDKLRGELKRFSGQVLALEKASLEQKETRLSLGARISDLRRRFEAAVRDKEREIQELKSSHRLLMERLKPEIATAQVSVNREKEHISIRLLDRVLFETGQAKLRPESKKALDEIYAGLGPIKDGLIVIEGHADDRRIQGALRGRFPTNWELSLARASAVVRYFQEIGMDPKRMSVAGYSYYRPADSNLSAIGRSRNRRVEIKLIPPISSPENGAPALTKQ